MKTALVRLAEPIALTSIFPYAWQLVLHYKIGDEKNAAFYAGLLISAFAFAEACKYIKTIGAKLLLSG